jgi:ERCC4-type nuclease
MMRTPPSKPTILRPKGIGITLPKPTLIIGSMEQRAYSFRRFHKWFAVIAHRKLASGDYSIAGLEDRVALERKSL